MEYPEFCQMGAISPDYPYLNLLDISDDSKHWANAMHHKYNMAVKENIIHLSYFFRCFYRSAALSAAR